MAVIAFITKIGSPPKPWQASFADGRTLGTFKSVRDAQVPIEATVPASLVRWTQVIGDGNVEYYRGET